MITLLLLLQAAGYGYATQAFVMAVLGVAGTFITQQIKQIAGAKDQLAVLLTVVVSVLLALGGAYFTGEMALYGIVAGTGLIFSTATIAYKLIYPNGGSTTTTGV